MRALRDSALRHESVVIAGLDPYPNRLPPGLKAGDEAGAVREFCSGVLGAVEEEVAAVKLQLAFFERLGPVGMEIYRDLVCEAAGMGLPVIADVKRGDIGTVASAYAGAHLGVYGATCVTVNPYMGSDAVSPFLEEARRREGGGGAFVLVLNSNPSATELQLHGEPPLFERVCGLVGGLGRRDGRYLDAGAVVGATRPELGTRVRELLPEALFLVPGYGAQGGGADAIRPLRDREGGGVLVNSSRGISYAYEEYAGPYTEAARKAAASMREELARAGVSP